MDKGKSKGNLSTLTSWEEVYLDTFDDNFDFNLNLASHAFKASEFSSMELFNDNFDLNWDSDSHALNASMFSTRGREMLQNHHIIWMILNPWMCTRILQWSQVSHQ